MRTCLSVFEGTGPSAHAPHPATNAVSLGHVIYQSDAVL